MNKYTIIYGTPEDVSSHVDILLDDKWELHGEMLINPHNGNCYQAMTFTPAKLSPLQQKILDAKKNMKKGK